MSDKIKYLLLVLFLPLLGFVKVSGNDSNITKEIVSNAVANNQTIDKHNNLKEKNNLYVFVGEKVNVKKFRPETEPNEIIMDTAFKAKYKVIQNIYGNYPKDIIEFEAYDHYGSPPFARYKNVLLFVSEYKGKLYHEKYQYFDVYKTIDGRWASCGDPYRFGDYFRENINAVKLEFENPLLIDLKKYNSREVKEIYVAPFFKIEKNKAVCLMGAYVEELFIVKKNGWLKAKGLF